MRTIEHCVSKVISWIWQATLLIGSIALLMLAIKWLLDVLGVI